jgi:hypothetical protein
MQGSTRQLKGLEPPLQAPPSVLLEAGGFAHTALQPPQKSRRQCSPAAQFLASQGSTKHVRGADPSANYVVGLTHLISTAPNGGTRVHQTPHWARTVAALRCRVLLWGVDTGGTVLPAGGFAPETVVYDTGLVLIALAAQAGVDLALDRRDATWTGLHAATASSTGTLGCETTPSCTVVLTCQHAAQ